MIGGDTAGTATTLAALSLMLATAGCTPPGPASSISFRNVGSGTAYAGDESCISCHEDQVLGYRGHGMSRSFYHDSTIARNRTPVDTTLLHAGTGLSYRVFSAEDTLYQEEIVPGRSPGDASNLRRRADFVMGSGNAARTFTAEINGRLFELPVTWYSQRRRWDFSPGYRSRNGRFSRQIPDRCMACHNGYPTPAGTADGKYTAIPSGIGCERCHGPGELHVNERLDVPEPPGDFDDSIVNPARLDPERRLDICQQCHLQTTVSVLRRDRHAFDFVPSERLSDHVALFFEPDVEGSDPSSVSVVSQADRMKRSDCYIATAGGPQPMECLTCHDPHAGFRQAGPEYFNEVCMECHATETLRTRVSPEAAPSHTESSNCFSCHMPRVEAEDAPHSSFTDHWIRIINEWETEPSPRTDGPLLPYFERDRANREGQTYLGMALAIQGRQAGDSQLMASGVATIEAGLQGDSGWGEALFLQGSSYLDLGRADLAIEPLRNAVRANEDHRYLDALARASAANGGSVDAVSALYERALTREPASFETRFHYAVHLHQTGRLSLAVAQYERVLDEYPWHPEAHLMLGTALYVSDAVGAADAFAGAALLDPDLREALRHVVIVNHATGEVTATDVIPGLASTGRGTIVLRAVPSSPADPGGYGLHIATGALLDEVRIFSSQGYLLRRIEMPQSLSAFWDLRDAQTIPVPTGLYLLRPTPGAGRLVRVVVVSLP